MLANEIREKKVSNSLSEVRNIYVIDKRYLEKDNTYYCYLNYVVFFSLSIN